ncbi:MAG TPA: hypothetical protein ENK23_01400, partial [Sorangium sp.]|nr:hypothetical protein [Sorangium sp.]
MRVRVAPLQRALAITWLLLGLVAMAGCQLVSDLHDYTFLPVANKVDLLLVVDTSRGTILADKVELFDNAIGGLVAGLANHVDDIHVGVISNSLGSYGADTCADTAANDHGRLLSRGTSGAQVATYRDMGFLVWDRNQTHSPPGYDDLAALKMQLREIVVGAGSDGCGFESTLEAWYRFLVEPAPSADVKLVDGVATPTGLDTILLQQRAAFLRPDSLLMVVVLSDENDCSLRVGAQNYLALQLYQPGGTQPYHLPPARAACALNPQSPCCVSCAQPSPVGCDDSGDMCYKPLTGQEDPINLRCFDQKRRFGVDFLTPIDRYVAGLGARRVSDGVGNLRDNPIFAHGRDPHLVIYGSIIGVPWQDLARRNDSGEPNIE